MRFLGDRSGSVEYAFKGDKVRLGVRGTGEDMDAIVDRSDKKLTLLLRDQKKYATVDLDRMMDRARKEADKVQVTKTGKRERIAGISCEWWELDDGKRKVSACLSKGPSYFDPETAERITGVDLPAWAERIAEEGYFPVRVNVTDASGKQAPVMELERWTESPVEPGDFQVPKDYQPVNRNELRQQLQKRVNPSPAQTPR